jgi:fructose-1,6-bisphosphatase/inositol monophosphatase family enzyme
MDHSHHVLAAVRQAARQVILPRYRHLGRGDVLAKTDPDDLVTIADTEAERLIAALLARSWPEARVLGEEAVSSQPALRDDMAGLGWTVIVDPIDGTWNFAKGLSVFGVIAAIAEAGQVSYGCLYDPLLDDWIEARAGGPARLVRSDGTAEELTCAAPEDPALWTGFVPLNAYPRSLRDKVALAGLGFGRIGSLGCSCHEYRTLAQGHAAFVLTGPVPQPWDHAAGALITQRAGGVVRFLDGQPYDIARKEGVVLFASSDAVWAKVAAAYAMLVGPIG